jgi:hypothetical protein
VRLSSRFGLFSRLFSNSFWRISSCDNAPPRLFLFFVFMERAYGIQWVANGYLPCRRKPGSGTHILRMYTMSQRGSRSRRPEALFVMKPSLSSKDTMFPAAVKSAVEIKVWATSAT